MRTVLMMFFCTLVAGCYTTLGKNCEGIETILNYELPVSSLELRKLRARGFHQCADYIEANDLIEIN